MGLLEEGAIQGDRADAVGAHMAGDEEGRHVFAALPMCVDFWTRESSCGMNWMGSIIGFEMGRDGRNAGLGVNE